MLVFETQVLKFCLYSEQTEAMGEGSINIERLAGDFILLVWRHGAECTHIVQAVSHLYEHDAYVLAHCQQQFAEILGLQGCFVSEDTAGDFGQSGDELCDFRAEMLLDILDGVVSVLDDVVEQRGANRCRAEANLLTRDFGHCYRVEYIGLARTAAYAFVGLFGKSVCAFDNLHFLAVVAFEITVKDILKGGLNHAVFIFRAHYRRLFHS